MDFTLDTEQVYQNNGYGTYLTSGDYEMLFEGYDSRKQEAVSRSTKIEASKLPVGVLKLNGERILSIGNDKYILTTSTLDIKSRSKELYTYVSRMNSVQNLENLRKIADENISESGAKICSSSMKAFFIEESENSKQAVMKLIYSANIEGEFL